MVKKVKLTIPPIDNLNPGNNRHSLQTLCFTDQTSQDVFISVLLVVVCAVEHKREG